MVVTELGRTNSVKPSQPENERSPIVVTVLGTVVLSHPTTIVLVAVSMMALQSSLESYTGFPS